MDRNQGILVKAFLLFSLALALLFTYIFVDHNWEAEAIEKRIGLIKARIQKLSDHHDSSFSYNQDISEKLGEIAREEKRCDMQSASLRLGQAIIKKDIKNVLQIWDQVARPFISLTANEVDFVEEEAETENHHRITGWVLSEYQRCSPTIHPILSNNSKITIMLSGNYYVYSQVPLPCNYDSKDPSFYRHFVEMKEEGDYGAFLLMVNSFQPCGETENLNKLSYQAGVFYLEAGSILYVSLSNPISNKQTELNTLSEKMEFGVYLL